MKTRTDVMQYALRRLGVVAADDPLTSDQQENAGIALDAIFAELELEAITGWTTDTVPDASLPGLGDMLAAEMSHSYGVQAPLSRGRAYLRLIATIRPDDRVVDTTDPQADYY